MRPYTFSVDLLDKPKHMPVLALVCHRCGFLRPHVVGALERAFSGTAED